MFTYRISRTVNTQKGVGLLEVLVAVLVLAIGIMALARFQGGLARSGSDAKARTIATNIAQGKMEELRSFNTASEFLAIVPGSDSDINRSGTIFRPSWTVTNYVNGTGSTLASPPTGTNPTIKRVEVSVSWTDPSGSNERVSIESFINSSVPSLSGQTLAAASGSQTSPTVGYRPGAAPEIIAIPSGSNLQEATSPKPDIVTAAGNRQVSFDEVTYDTTSYNTVLKRDSFRTVNCFCEFGGSGNGLTPAYLDIYDESKNTWIPVGGEWKEGQMISKATGIASSTGGGPSAQPDLCNICCRDHHDPNNSDHHDPNINPIVYEYDHYDPFRHTSTGDHDHYSSSSLTSAVTSGDYLESCRFVRINGIWRVPQDWRLESLQVVPNSDISTSTGITNLRNYVLNFVGKYISDIDTSYPITTPSINPATTSDATLMGAWQNLANIEATDTVTSPPNDQTLTATSPSPDSVTCPTGSSYCKQLIGRAIYIDFMDSEWIGRLSSFNPSTDMDKVPVHEVNITQLARWAKQNSTVNIIDQGISTSAYTRGLVHGQTLNNNSWVRAHIKRSNTGLTDSLPIDPDDDFPVASSTDCSYPYPFNDYLNFVVGTSSSAGSIQCPANTSGTINIITTGSPSSRMVGGISVGNLTMLPDPDSDCSPSLLGSGGSSSWSCYLDPSSSIFKVIITGYTVCKNNDPGVGQYTMYDNQIRSVESPTGWTYSPLTVTGNNTISDTTTITFTKGAGASGPPYTGFNFKIGDGVKTINTGICP